MLGIAAGEARGEVLRARWPAGSVVLRADSCAGRASIVAITLVVVVVVVVDALRVARDL